MPGRRRTVDRFDLMNRLACGQTQREIAEALPCDYRVLRQMTSEHVRDMGCRTLAQAIAQHVAVRIRAGLPLALKPQVDQLIEKLR